MVGESDTRSVAASAPRSRFAVVDSHPAIRIGVTAALRGQPDIEVVAAAGTVDDLLAHARCDVALLDLRLADGSGPARNTLRLRAAGTRVLAFGSGAEPALVREAARAGCHGMVRASEPVDVLLAAVRAVLRGEVVASTDWAAALDGDDDAGGRSPFQHRVLELVAAGARPERVATELGVTTADVRTALLAVRDGYVRPAWRHAGPEAAAGEVP